MKITTIGHASLLIETNGLTVLTDPWWKGPCFGATWWVWPRPFTEALPDEIDYIYISHGHHDHFHQGTLKTLNKNATVLVARSTGLARPIEELGFPVVEFDDEPLALRNGVTAQIIPTFADDTLLVLQDGSEVLINANDALHSAPQGVQDRFITALPKPDYLYCGFGVASHFPNCYRIPGKDYEATAARRQRYFNGQWCRIVAGIEPRFAIPFAADVVLLDESLIWANEPTHNAERPTDMFRREHPESETTVIDAAPGFTFRNGHVARELVTKPLDVDRLRREYVDEIKRANYHGHVSDEGFEAAFELVRANVETCRAYLESGDYDYRFLIRFHNDSRGIAITKSGGLIDISKAGADSYDLAYTTSLSYLRWSLTQPYGHEILFVGSGGIFEYEDRRRVADNLHVELSTVLRRQAIPPTARTKRPRWRAVLADLLGRNRGGLYDLDAWTVYSDQA